MQCRLAGGCHRLHATASMLATLGKALAAAEPRFERSLLEKLLLLLSIHFSTFIHLATNDRGETETGAEAEAATSDAAT